MSLSFVEQQACLRETIISERNGESIDIHYVVKRTPFIVVLRATGTTFNFKTGSLKAELLYDAGAQGEVVVPDGGPALEFVAHASADGKECSVDLRLLVLTTQANGIRFVVRFTLSPKTGASLPISADSAPVVVVSKQQQIRNKEAEVMREKDPNASRTKKRVRTDDVFGVLEEILAAQRQTLALVGGGDAAAHRKPKIDVKQEPAYAPQARDLSVEEALDALVHAYRREALVSGLQRPAKIRRVLASQDVSTQKELKEIGFALTLSEITSPSELNLSTDRFSSLDDEPFNHHMDEVASESFEQHWTPLNSFEHA